MTKIPSFIAKLLPKAWDLKKEDAQREMKLGYFLQRHACYRANNCNRRQEKWTNPLEQMKEITKQEMLA